MNNADLILILILSLIVAIQGFYHVFFFRKLAHYCPETSVKKTSPPVSIVICAHNEGSNLQVFLPIICRQDYADFEVIVVNDRSEDTTPAVLTALEKTYTHLKSIHIEQTPAHTDHKKYALEQGIQAAHYHWILVTDADCYPASPHWITRMTDAIGEGTQLVLGFAPYEQKKGLLNKFVQIDTFLTAVQYLSYALAGRPYMGVGRNTMYAKSLFLNATEREQYRKVTGGDDDLFIKDVATRHNTCICVHSEAHVYSVPPDHFKKWIIQKTRHLSVGKYYSGKIQALLAGYQLSTLFYYIISLYLLIGINEIWWVLLLIGLRTYFIFVNFKYIRCNLKSFFSLKWFFMLESLYTLLIGCIGALGVFYKRIRWK